MLQRDVTTPLTASMVIAARPAPVFFTPGAIAQWTGFMGSLAADAAPTIAARP